MTILRTETRDLSSPSLLVIAVFGAVLMTAGWRRLKDPDRLAAEILRDPVKRLLFRPPWGFGANPQANMACLMWWHGLSMLLGGAVFVWMAGRELLHRLTHWMK